MNRAILRGSLISEVISRGRRGPSGFGVPTFARNSGDVSKAAQSRNPFRGEASLWSVKTYLHTSAQCHTEESLQTHKEKEKSEDDNPSEREPENDYSERSVDDAPVEAPGGDGGIIDRLRRLSMTDADDYELSPMAQDKARENAKVREEMIRNGEQWKWDQRNLRPGGPPPPPPRYRRNDNYGRYDNYGGYGREDNFRRRRESYEEEDDYHEYEDRRYRDRDRFSNRQRERDDFVEDSPDDYENEMQKLRERLAKNKQKHLASEDRGNSDRNHTPEMHHNISETGNKRRSSVETFSVAKSSTSSHVDYGQPSDDFTDYSKDAINLELVEKDPNSFGNLSFPDGGVVRDKIGEEIRNQLLEEEKAVSTINEEEEEDDSKFIPQYGERWNMDKLIKKVRELLREKKLTEAVDTYLGVLKEGGFQFDDDALRHHFNVLINECADVGYVDMAFRLFNLMKKRGLKENKRTISSLLNACANSPWDKDNNLDRIDKLLLNMKDRGLDPNLINYHALIKAYGRLGETVRAFHVVDQMIAEAEIRPTTETFNMLLQACITDTKNGFRYTVITWRKLLSMKKLRPDIYSYNLLLKAVHDCGIDMKTIEFNETSNEHKLLPYPDNSGVPLLPPVVTVGDSNRLLNFLVPEDLKIKESKIMLDNLGEPTQLDIKAFVKSLAYPTNRIQIFGGIRGIISQMVRHKVPPNMKTLTSMIHVSNGSSDISDILQLLEAYKLKPDSPFFTLALKQCYVNENHKLAEEILKLMNNVYHITPNIITWTVLALGCRTWPEAKALLQEVDELHIVPDIRLMGSLLFSASRQCDPIYVFHVLEETMNRDIAVEEKFLLTIDRFIKTTQRDLVSLEMGKPVSSKKITEALERNPDLSADFTELKQWYARWIQTVTVKVYPENPWKEEFEHFNLHKKHKPKKTDDYRYESYVNETSKSEAA